MNPGNFELKWAHCWFRASMVAEEGWEWSDEQAADARHRRHGGSLTSAPRRHQVTSASEGGHHTVPVEPRRRHGPAIVGRNRAEGLNERGVAVSRVCARRRPTRRLKCRILGRFHHCLVWTQVSCTHLSLNSFVRVTSRSLGILMVPFINCPDIMR